MGPRAVSLSEALVAIYKHSWKFCANYHSGLAGGKTQGGDAGHSPVFNHNVGPEGVHQLLPVALSFEVHYLGLEAHAGDGGQDLHYQCAKQGPSLPGRWLKGPPPLTGQTLAEAPRVYMREMGVRSAFPWVVFDPTGHWSVAGSCSRLYVQ